MAFYKLFCVVHRRTDWPRLLEWERRIMMPEWYEERDRRAKQAWARVMMPAMVLGNILSNEYR